LSPKPPYDAQRTPKKAAFSGGPIGESDHGADGVAGRAAVIVPVVSGPGSGLAGRGRSQESRLEEAIGLAEAIHLEIVFSDCVRVNRPRAPTFLGAGAIDSLKPLFETEEVKVVVFDGTLTPVQQRNLETEWKCKVIDRTGLILEIFGERARTREGRLQVELAALTYQRSRLVRSWTHLERQRGGVGFLGGPGETQIESDRRQIDSRIAKIKGDLKKVARTRGLHRAARKRVPFPVVALVGYTNAGKSTLFNRITKSEVFAEDLLFATLDPTMRGVTLESGRKIILSDTVGFVSDLPTDLVAAFRATLEEVLSADLVIHVRDISHADSEAQKRDVFHVLTELGLSPKTDDNVIEVLNKTDLLGADDKARIETSAEHHDDTVALSAITGDGMDGFTAAIDGFFAAKRRIYDYTLAASEGANLAWLYAHGEVLERTDDETGTTKIRVALDPENAARYEHARAKDC
jgi:GTP-binding protein HflX